MKEINAMVIKYGESVTGYEGNRMLASTSKKTLERDRWDEPFISWRWKEKISPLLFTAFKSISGRWRT